MQLLTYLTLALPLVAAMPVHVRQPGTNPLHIRKSRSMSSLANRACKLRAPASITAAAPSSSSSSVVPTTSTTAQEAWSSSSVANVVAAAVATPSSSSQYVQQEAAYVAPTSSSVYVAPVVTTTTQAAAATTAAAASSDSGTVYSGELTYYAMGLGSCGVTSTDADYSLAVSELLFDGFDGYTGANPNDNPICGKKIKAMLGGNTVTMTVVDRCTACAIHDLDFSPTAFQALTAGVTQNSNTGLGIGRATGLTWEFV